MDDGTVARAIVVLVLQSNCDVQQFTVRVDGNVVTLVKDGVPESHVLPERIPRKMLQRLAHKYGVPIDHFYHSADYCVGSQTKQ